MACSGTDGIFEQPGAPPSGPGTQQEVVADRAGLHRTEISLLELGKRTPCIDTVVRVMGALGVGPAEAFTGATWVPFSEKPGGYVKLQLRSPR
ncbi:MAG: helix-turn-helix transcriptional regulator [Actinobacteria bacterium]|nr:helix-turn-helix transcriptional regulator [Actinomycetota bacterium]